MQSTSSQPSDEAFVIINDKGKPIPGPGKNYRIVPGRSSNSRLFLKEKNLYTFEKAKTIVPGEPLVFYMKCHQGSKCRGRSQICRGFMTSVQAHSCDSSKNLLDVEVNECYQNMKKRAASEQTGYTVNVNFVAFF